MSTSSVAWGVLVSIHQFSHFSINYFSALCSWHLRINQQSDVRVTSTYVTWCKTAQRDLHNAGDWFHCCSLKPVSVFTAPCTVLRGTGSSHFPCDGFDLFANSIPKPAGALVAFAIQHWLLIIYVALLMSSPDFRLLSCNDDWESIFTIIMLITFREQLKLQFHNNHSRWSCEIPSDASWPF